jgi:hypothetical protein
MINERAVHGSVAGRLAAVTLRQVGVAQTVDLRLQGGTVSTVDTGLVEGLSTGRRG